jgi:hypothetical protein
MMFVAFLAGTIVGTIGGVLALALAVAATEAEHMVAIRFREFDER